MPSLLNKVADFARSPRGRRLAESAKQYAQKPENRRRIEQLRQRLVTSRGTGRGPNGRNR